ncbi:GGDEF domain-containing protein [Pseudalkalibacillus caeni]|uniref:GGDEF domain-containing protein n=1 Tax=Exobacillus caeni TaxID=2574798 RepID=A0A5R9F101_9BACL|nr:GGDEF domain-containing protein [Pseudalkalibacillus caeni]TLS36671.1 GGDEF domain-containing protein [Pseudalkalibacillus caeni]
MTVLHSIPSLVWFISFAVLGIPLIVDDVFKLDEALVEMTWFLTLIPTLLLSYYGGLHLSIVTLIFVAVFHSLFEVVEIFIEQNPLYISIFLTSIFLQVLIGLTVGVLSSKVKEKESHLERLNKELEKLSSIDELTGVYNRRGFLMLSRQAIISSPVSSCLYLDLDGFKQVNDKYGHETGDELLKNVARLIKSCVQEEDVVGRLGGDEYVVFLKDGDENRAVQVASQIKNAFSEAIIINNETCTVTPSIGIAGSPADGKSIEELLLNSDSAMYRAKKQGKNGYSIYTEPGLYTV